ncbi:Cytosine deaminase FCY1 [Pseudoloma neurophilia]|uniref:Cytosine deaminase FCY1 n=1 Tax=Pseudoloma neurophilia TaxID=146866 RepID=A0A0R0LU54_9MICR|nr:Cytosine deaminase FCY1 [Pseudoloma neurophilia]
MNDDKIDLYMERALVQARKALIEKEVPVGCVFLRNEQIIAETHNLTNQELDPLAHAELVAIRKTDCSNCTVFLTCEPCIMCQGLLDRLNCKVYFGCYNTTFGANLLKENKNIFRANQECVDLLRKFYKNENENAPIEKRKIKKQTID